ncbi:putative uncharacterized protein DDB_G0271606 [Chrysoperla carnea]|uniref:putative uncharacterized protein DDB_G0271606 n=1 Tax=Chrysoperla carnea TaxID=189513 RepID=UPI001D06BF52|nr:putative uncharacterized protein DDB_G0271606 [Chrysoperla carnea]
MLDEKIENGPDYDSSSEIEQMKENERLTSLLQDWETASAASRSLPSTPRHYPHQQQNTQSQHYPQQHPHSQQHVLQHQSSITSSKHHPPHHQQMGPIPQNHQNYIANTATIQKQQIIHQPAMNMLHHHHPTYGGPPAGSVTMHNPPFQTYSPPTHHHTGNPSIAQQPHSAPPLTVFSKVVPGMQYTESLSLNSQIKQNLTNFVAQRQLQIAAAQQAHVVQHYHHPMSMVAPRDVPSMVQNYSGTYSNTSQSSSSQVMSSPIHKHSRIPSANIQPTQQTPPHLVRQNSGNIVYNAALPQHSSISMYTSPASSAASQQSPSAQSSINPDYTNGELILQQQLYNQQLKSHLSKEIQQYKQSREQLLIKQQQQQQQQEQQILVQTQHAIVAQHNKPTRIMPANPQQQQQQQSYQSSVEMNLNRTATTGTDPMSPKMVYRKQNTSSTTTTARQYSQEMT